MANIKAPLVLGFQITGNCTLNCAYCYAQSAAHIYMPLSDAKRVASEIISLGIFSISIEGGEPLLHPHWYDITKLFVNAGLEVAILTNGTICDTITLNKLLSLVQQSDIFTIQVSLDSDNSAINDKTRGKGKQVLQNLLRMVEIGLDPVVATVVHSINMKTIFPMIKTLSHRIKKYHFMNVMPISCFQHWDTPKKVYKRLNI